MEAKRTVVRGLAIDVVVVEAAHRDASGKHIWYVATIYVRERKTGVQKLIRRTRIPGSGQALARDVQRLGVRALDAITA